MERFKHRQGKLVEWYHRSLFGGGNPKTHNNKQKAFLVNKNFLKSSIWQEME